MSKDDIKDEIIKYTSVLETNYNMKIQEMRQRIEHSKRLLIGHQSERVNTYAEKSELESIFVDCIEEIRKDIMRRRLKNEIQNKKKFK